MKLDKPDVLDPSSLAHWLRCSITILYSPQRRDQEESHYHHVFDTIGEAKRSGVEKALLENNIAGLKMAYRDHREMMKELNEQEIEEFNLLFRGLEESLDPEADA